MISILLSFIVTCNPPELAQDATEFAAGVYEQIDAKENRVFSPYSLFSCLSMVYAGAQENTALEMRKVLHLSVPQKGLPRLYGILKSELASDQLQVANALWADRDTFFLSDFTHSLQENYDAKLQAVDFSKIAETVSIINAWTSTQTSGKVEKLLQDNDINPMTRMVLTNAVYFKGDWKLPFSVKLTADGLFRISEEDTKQVPMMHQTSHFPYFENDQVQILGMPFKDGKSACFIILPKEGQELTFSAEQYKEWVCSLAEENVAVTLPSFSLKSRFDMNDVLEQMGMQEAFTAKANFSGINGTRDLFLSKVVHEAVFVLNETGVVAAAATAASMMAKAIMQKIPPINFIADHPFLFMIIDLKTQTPLFLGKLQDP